MVWLSVSFDPSGDFLFEQTCKALLELASRDQGSLCIDSHNPPFPDWNRPYAEQREHQEQCQFLLWQFATNPNPKREVGRYHIHFRMVGMKTFTLQVGVYAPYKPGQHLLFSQSIMIEDIDKAQNPPVALLVLNAMEEGSWPLTTGKLAYFLEQFAAIGRICPMPQELRRDLEARAGKPLQKDELGEWPYLTKEQVGRLLPSRKDSLYGRFLDTTYKDGSLELTPRDADFSDQTDTQG